MLELWSPATRYGLWRRLWLALAEAQRELGVKIPEDAIRQMKANLDNIDFDAVARYEKRFRHDVMAHVHAFGDVAPKAKPFIHLGATSAYVTDNADLILMRRGLDLLRGRALDVLRSLAAFAEQWRDQPTLGYTHLQPGAAHDRSASAPRSGCRIWCSISRTSITAAALFPSVA